MKNFKLLSLCLLLVSTLMLSACVGESIDKTNQQAQEAFQEETTKQDVEINIPVNCVSWFDGCNNCFVIDGEVGGCTRKYCPEEAMQEPRCLKTMDMEKELDEMVIKVGPEKMECMGVAPMECLVVDGELFYEDIEGFYFEAGFEYKLRVKKSLAFGTDDPEQIPADASMYKYELVDILSKTEK